MYRDYIDLLGANELRKSMAHGHSVMNLKVVRTNYHGKFETIPSMCSLDR